MENHLSPQQLATRWNVSTSILQKWRSKGTGPLFLKFPGIIRYRAEDVKTFEKENTELLNKYK